MYVLQVWEQSISMETVGHNEGVPGLQELKICIIQKMVALLNVCVTFFLSVTFIV